MNFMLTATHMLVHRNPSQYPDHVVVVPSSKEHQNARFLHNFGASYHTHKILIVSVKTSCWYYQSHSYIPNTCYPVDDS